MSERNGNLLNTEGLNKPDTLTDEALGNFLAGVGNHEVKALLLCAMQKDTLYSIGDVHKIVISAQGENPGWIINKGTLNSYFPTLEKVSLVTRKISDSSYNTYGYVRTPIGDSQGQALAGLLLDFSLRHSEISLQDLGCGQSSSNKTKDIEMEGEEAEYKPRSPFNRYTILKTLLQNEYPLKIIDIANLTKLSVTRCSSHLQALRASGLVFYDSKESGEPFIVLTLDPLRPSEPPDTYKRYTKLTQAVYEVLLSEGEGKIWTYPDIAKEVIKSHYGRNMTQHDVRHVSGVLTFLRRKKYVEAEKFTGEVQSEVSLKPEKRKLTTDFISLIELFQSQDSHTLELGTSMASEIIANPTKVADLFRKAKEHSHHANAKPKKETLDSIIAIIANNPGVTIRRITQLINEQSDISYKEHTIMVYVNELEKANRIYAEKIRLSKRLSIV